MFKHHHHHHHYPDYVETDPTGRYGRFDEVLGKGAMKIVYKAIDELLGMEVAWNQVRINDAIRSSEDLQRLYSEVHLLSTLHHESIMKFFTSWIDVSCNTFNFITEMFSSGSLREYQRKYRRVDVRAIKSWARQILRGLVYLHCHDPPVIHRDLKCDNIFVNGHLGEVKIGDLGLAAVLQGSKSAHSVIGTPEFMAPELYEEDYNELVDVYSFGMCVLEMFTLEYPYSECINPAQIYKKVTSGKLPEAFYKIQDFEAQRFIGKCLVNVSKRLSAKEILDDPFLAFDEHQAFSIRSELPFLNEKEMEKLQLGDHPPRTDMTITGKLDPQDDTIFLKVQISDKDGDARNIYFPFDVLNDTPMNVATEMVKELEITNWEPEEIAEMIEAEIHTLLVPEEKKWDSEDDDEPVHPHHSFSSCSSSQSSMSGLLAHGHNWIQDDFFDDTSSQSSSHSGYSKLSYFSGDEHSPTRKDKRHLTRMLSSTRFGPQEHSYSAQSIARNCYDRCKDMLDSQNACSSKHKRAIDKCRLVRNRSLVDVHSQLLHRSLVEEVQKRRLFKTAGDVENIGFQSPLDIAKKLSQKSAKKKHTIS
ncbi:hypothetical protein ACFE04_014065 [Oxalis oulophora]